MIDKEVWTHIDARIKSYEGDARILESSLGAFYLGTLIGWRPLMLIHTMKTYNRYQDILGLKFKDYMPEQGSYASKSHAFCEISSKSEFWKAVRGDNPGRSSDLIKIE